MRLIRSEELTRTNAALSTDFTPRDAPHLAPRMRSGVLKTSGGGEERERAMLDEVVRSRRNAEPRVED